MFPRHFELRYRVRNSLQIAKNGEASVTIAGPFHEVRSSSPARLYEPTMFFASLRCARSAKIRNSPPSNAAVTFDAETPRVTGKTSRLRPFARIRRFSVAAAITALALLTRSKRYSSIRVWGLGIAKRRGLRRVVVAVARKLAVQIHRIWADGTDIAGSERPPSMHERQQAEELS